MTKILIARDRTTRAVAIPLRVLTIVVLVLSLFSVFPAGQPVLAFDEPDANAQLTVIKQIDNQEDTRGDGTALNVCEVVLRVDRLVNGAPEEVVSFAGAEPEVCLADPQATTGTTTVGLDVDVDRGSPTETFMVSEPEPDSRYLVTFGGDCDLSGRVALAPGDNRTCTVTNTYLNEQSMDDANALLTVFTQVENGDDLDGTGLSVCDFEIVVRSQATFDEVAGFPAEAGSACNQPDLLVGTTQLGLEVDNVSHDVTVPSRFLITEPDVDPRYMATFSGDCVGGVVVIRKGEHQTCVITNTLIDGFEEPGANAVLTVVKVLDNQEDIVGDGRALDLCEVELRVGRLDGTEVDTFPAGTGDECGDPTATSGATDLGINVDVERGSSTETFVISESTLADAYMATFAGDCDLNGRIVLAPGEHRTCVVTNTLLHEESMAGANALLTVIKLVDNGAGAELNACDFQIEVVLRNTGGSVARFAAESGQICGQGDLVEGTTQLGLTVNSDPRDGALATTFVVSEPDLDARYVASFSGDCAGGVVTLPLGEQLTCIVTNTLVDDLPPTNNAPVAGDDAYATDEDSVLSVAAVVGVLANDSDAEDDPLTASVVAEPQHGDLTLSADGSFDYVPDDDFNGSDSFSYSATDGSDDSNVAVVTISVRPVDDAAVVSINDSVVEVAEGQVATNSGTVSDADGDVVTLSASVGEVTNNGDDTWSWTLDTTDGPAESQTVTINGEPFALVVANVAPAATIVGAPATSDEGSPVSLNSVLSDPGTADTQTVAWDVTKNGVAFAAGAGSNLTFTPDDDGAYVVRLTATDDDGGVGGDTVSVIVGNVAPDVTLGVGAVVRAGETVVLGGSFSDPGADAWTGTFDPGDGRGPRPLSLNADKTFNASYRYPMDGDFTLTICVNDDDGGVDCETASVRVTGYAIFAGRDRCGGDALSISGSSSEFIGDVHSNGGMKISGSSHAIDGSATYRCDVTVSGSRNTFVSGPDEVSQIQPWPTALTAGDFDCDISVSGTLDLSKNGVWWLGGKANSRQLLPLTLCAAEIKLSGSSISGTVTLVAGAISISGSNLRLTAHDHGVVAFATGPGNDAIKISGSNTRLAGDLVAMSGQISLSGSNGTVLGSLIGWTIKLSGSNWTIDPQ